MLSTLFEFASASVTIPHGYCLLWQPWLLALHTISNALITLSYIAIPIAIYIFIRRKHQYLIHEHLLWMFAAFIIACALTHLMGAVVIWKPYYLLQGVIMAMTALISIITAIELIRKIPKLLQLPTITQLQEINRQLTEQIAKREALEKQLRLTQFSIDTASEGIYWIRSDASILYANQAASSMLGYSLSEFLRLKISDINPEHSQELWGVHWQELKLKKSLNFEAPVQKKSGTFITVAISANFVEYEGEEYNCAFVRDISEQKQAEQYLRDTLTLLTETENQNRLILNSTSEGIYGVDQEGLATFVNQAACNMLGYRTDEIKYQDMHTLIHHSYFDGSPYPLEKCPMYLSFSQGINKSVTNEVLWRKDGSCFAVEYTSSPIIDSGNVIGAVIVFSDITERQQTQQRLNDLLDLNQKIISQSPVGVKVFSGSGQCVTCNEAAAKTLDKSVSEMLQENIYNINVWQKASLIDTALKCLQENIPQRQEIHTTLASGKEVWLDYHFATFSSNREPHLLVLIHNITEYRQTEIALRTAEMRAIQANQAKSEFLANMSHEIRTPMNAILGFSSILKNLVSNTTQKYYLEAIERSGQTLLQLINDVLDLSKVEAGKLTLQYHPTSLKTLLNDIHIVFWQKIADKNLDFFITIAEDLPEYLLLDDVRLRQILLNLVGNAVKFTQSGFIKITATGKIHETGNLFDLTVKVCDSGIGIAKDQQEKIFTAFTQQDNQSVVYGGTGLGLTICLRLLELMDGSISVESEVNKGSCFTLTLNNIKIAIHPVKSENKLPSATHLNFYFQPARILLVDDLLFNRQLIQSYLAEFPELTLVEAEDGEQTLNLVNQQHFDLILMDRRLPGENGDEVCRKIKALPTYANIPIIMITASVLTVQEQHFPIAYDKQLNKPIQKEDLLAAMQLFLPWQEKPSNSFHHLPEEPELSQTAIPQTQDISKLIELLSNDYQIIITTLKKSSAFQIDRLIEIADELLNISEQYHCQPLKSWASTLKNQAELFDLDNLPKTLHSFDGLLQELQSNICNLESLQIIQH